MIRFGSLCSGIEAAGQAWRPLGWSPVFFSEIERTPSAVLAHHYPEVPNLGDMTKFEEWDDYAIDLLVGGTPCQDYSVAGKRLGMAGDRGQLSLTYIEIAARFRPRWALWENVPGVLTSNGGRDFARFLGDLAGVVVDVPEGGWKNGGIIPGIGDAYGIAYRVLDAQYCRTHAFLGAVPQRRRRVFVVGYLGDWRRAAAVLLDPEGLRRGAPPCREPGQNAAPTLSARTKGGGGLGTDFDLDGGLLAFGGGNTAGPIDVSTTLNQRLDFDSETFIAQVASTLPAGGNATGGDRQPGTSAETAATMLVAYAIQAGALRVNPESGPDGVGVATEVAYTLEARAEVQAVAKGYAVRRLTPLECTRLQGFPDDYFDGVQIRGKKMADGPIYKALGNSMAVNVMQVIGERIAMVDAYAS